jgi:hypothetical protein
MCADQSHSRCDGEPEKTAKIEIQRHLRVAFLMALRMAPQGGMGVIC